MNFTVTFENKKFDFESFTQYLKFKLYDELEDKSTYSADNKKRLLFTVFIDDTTYQGMSFTQIFNGNCLHSTNEDVRTSSMKFGCIENMKTYFNEQSHVGKHKALVIMNRF
jgi:hypothetical protein